MKKFLEQNRVFLFLYLLFLVSGAAIIALLEKGDDILYFNSLHHPFFDGFFKWITHLGEFPAILLILLTIVFTNYGKGFLLAVNLTIVFVMITCFKQMLFADQLRPSAFFDGKAELHFVQGVEMLRYNSFPSGHTAVAFALFFMLSILSKDKRWSAVLFAVALLVGVSRVYLLQHFFRDVYFGAMLGMITSTVLWLTLGQSKFYNGLKWKDKALFQ